MTAALIILWLVNMLLVGFAIGFGVGHALGILDREDAS